MENQRMKKSYYAIIPSNVRYDSTLTPNAKLLYGELTALANQEGYCWASNGYFSELYSATTRSISKWISQLAAQGYINIELIYEGKQVKQRRIWIAEPHEVKDTTPRSNLPTPIEDNFHTLGKECSKRILQVNNTINTTSNKGRFARPTVNEIKDYCLERNNAIDADRFFDFYESKGWLVGKNKMKCWKSSIRTWEKRANDSTGKVQIKKRMEKDVFERLTDSSWADGSL